MCSTFSAELAVSASDLNGLECEPSRSVKSIPSAEPSSPSIGLMSHVATISPTGNFERERLTLSAAVSPARTSATQATAPDLPASVRDSGGNSYEPFAWYDQSTRSWRTWQHCLVEGWAPFSETWPRSGRMRNGIAYRRAPLVPLTSAIASGSLLPTPRAEGMDSMGSGKHSKDSLIIQARTWPTPRAAMTGAATPNRLNDKNRNLETAVAKEMWPTPRAADGMCHALKFPPRPARGRLEDAVANVIWRTPNATDATKWSNQSLAERQAKGQQIRLNTQVSPEGGAGGQLNPPWVEWLMGFPIGWTALKDWATPSSRKSRKLSVEPSCERRMTGENEWTCDRCKSLWYGELAKTDWRPSECPAYSVSSQDRVRP